MDKIRGFLSRVIPWGVIDGQYSIHWQRPGTKGFPGRCFSNLDDMVAFLANPPPGCNIYFCMACHSGERKRAHVKYLSTLYMDVDVHDNETGHVVHPVACVVVLWFCKAYGIPNPTLMVASGSGGLHVYWCSKTALTLEQWQPFAEALKWAIENYKWQAEFNRGCSENNFPELTVKVDAFVTTDATRVLRVPGFDNFKHNPPRPVRVIRSASCDAFYDFDSVFAGLKTKAANEHAKAKSEFVLGEAVETHKVGPVPFAPIKEGCAFLRTAYETGGKDYDEPKWHMTTLCAVFMEDGNTLAHKFGNQHCGYNYDDAEEKWARKCKERDERGVGWPSCKAISDCEVGECQSCPHFAKGKTPLHLALDALRDREQRQELEELEADRPEELYLPRGYAVSKKTGYICAISQQYNRKKQPVGPKFLSELFLCDITDPIAQIVNGVKGISFFEKSGLDPTVRRFVALHEFDSDKLKKLGINNRSKNSNMITTFGESWFDTMRRMKASRDLTSLGWRYEDGKIAGFVYGGTYFRVDGSIESSGLNTEDNVLKWYQPTGGKESWYHAAKLLTDRRRDDLNTLLCVGFASPLMVFAGTIYGGFLSSWGLAGTSKSTVQQLACALWAHPKFGRESVSSTRKSVLNKLGMIKHLPTFWDDIHDEARQEHLFQTIFEHTEGVEGGRLDTNVVQRVRGEWQTLMVVCSNASFCDYVVRKQPSTTAGLRRVLEFEVIKDPNETGKINEFDAIKVYAELEHNYGMVGYGYAQILATEHMQIEAMVGETVKRFKAKVHGTAEETYWWGLSGLLVAGANMALRMGVEIDPARIENFLANVFYENRTLRDSEGTEGGSKAHTWNALLHFIKFASIRNVIITDVFAGYGGKREVRVRNEQQLRQLGRGPLFYHVATEEQKIRISKKEFRKYLEDQKIKPRQVITGLEKHFGAKVDQYKATLGGGTHWAIGQEDIIELPIPEGLLEELLNGVDEDPTPEG